MSKAKEGKEDLVDAQRHLETGSRWCKGIFVSLVFAPILYFLTALRFDPWEWGILLLGYIFTWLSYALVMLVYNWRKTWEGFTVSKKKKESLLKGRGRNIEAHSQTILFGLIFMSVLIFAFQYPFVPKTLLFLLGFSLLLVLLTMTSISMYFARKHPGEFYAPLLDFIMKERHLFFLLGFLFELPFVIVMLALLVERLRSVDYVNFLPYLIAFALVQVIAIVFVDTWDMIWKKQRYNSIKIEKLGEYQRDVEHGRIPSESLASKRFNEIMEMESYSY